jgi:solute carrier family 25 (mitochondrial citrate transporter), member 1
VFGSVGKDAVRFLSFDMIKNAFRDPETGALTPWRNMFAGQVNSIAGCL